MHRLTVSNRRAVILLVEDAAAEQELTHRVFVRSRIPCELRVVSNGVEALEYLEASLLSEGRGEYPHPDLILLDLNMPRMDGREFLAAVKVRSELCAIPVVVLTTSDAEEDVLASYGAGANSFITKPIGLPDFVRVLEDLCAYWFGLVVLPQRRTA